READPLQARVPQCDAARHRRIAGRVHQCILRGLAADRDGLFVGWPRPAWLCLGDQPRLPDHVRDALCLHLARARLPSDRGHHLPPDRSAHRLRVAESVMDATVDTSPPPREEAPPRGRYLKSPIAKRRWRTFKDNRRAYWSMWLFLLLCVVSIGADFIAN